MKIFLNSSNFIKNNNDTNELGATSIEYALLCGLVALTIISGAGFLGDRINVKLIATGTAVTDAGTAGN